MSDYTNISDSMPKIRAAFERTQAKVLAWHAENDALEAEAAGERDADRAAARAIVREHHWDFRHRRPSELSRMFAAVGTFAIDFLTPGVPGRMLSLLGQSGRGKTHLALKALDCWRDNRKSERTPWKGAEGYEADGLRWSIIMEFRWTHYARLVNERDFEAVGRMVANAIEADFLVLDDIFATSGTPAVEQHSREAVHGILETRLHKRKWTLVTSNLSMAELRAYDERIASRLLRNDSTVFELTDSADFLRKEKQP